VLALLPAKRQNLLFSATFPDEIRKLANSFMRDPVTVEVAPRNKPVELISQIAIPVDSGRKRELLAHLVKTNNWQQVLVFTRTKHGANRLAQQLEREGIDADAIHGNKSQGARTRALKRFKDSELQVLVATDIAARGLDIEELPHVVNYDLPHVAEDYLHRIGRTGRAGATGEAIALVSGEDRPLLAAIERLTGRRIEQRVIAGFELGTGSRAPAQPREPQRHERGRSSQPRRHNGNGASSGQSRQHSGNSSGNRSGNSNGNGQQRPPHGNSGNRQQQGGERHRNESRPQRQGPRQGQGPNQRHGQYPQRTHNHQQPATARKPLPDEQAEEQQPPPERAGNQMFPGVLGDLGRRIFGRKSR
jgi:ATP-dependent RNA helicase RhlE